MANFTVLVNVLLLMAVRCSAQDFNIVYGGPGHLPNPHNIVRTFSNGNCLILCCQLQENQAYRAVFYHMDVPVAYFDIGDCSNKRNFDNKIYCNRLDQNNQATVFVGHEKRTPSIHWKFWQFTFVAGNMLVNHQPTFDPWLSAARGFVDRIFWYEVGTTSTERRPKLMMHLISLGGVDDQVNPPQQKRVTYTNGQCLFHCYQTGQNQFFAAFYLSAKGIAKFDIGNCLEEANFQGDLYCSTGSTNDVVIGFLNKAGSPVQWNYFRIGNGRQFIDNNYSNHPHFAHRVVWEVKLAETNPPTTQPLTGNIGQY